MQGDDRDGAAVKVDNASDTQLMQNSVSRMLRSSNREEVAPTKVISTSRLSEVGEYCRSNGTLQSGATDSGESFNHVVWVEPLEQYTAKHRRRGEEVAVMHN